MISSHLTAYPLHVLLLLILLAQMAAASPVQSAAFDESYHVTFGYAYLRTGDIRLSRGQNPPLTNVLLALPLLMLDDVVLPIDHPTWSEGDVYGFADEFLWKANPEPHRRVMLARLPEMALALVLACMVYAFARSHFGERAALAALLLCAFDPNLIAQGHIAGTDLGVTLFMFGAVWMLAAAVKRRSLRRTIVAGLLAGAALSSKYSAVWLGPIALVIGAIYPGQGFAAFARFKHLVVFGLVAFAVIWLTFGLSIGPLSPGGLPVPAPDYWSSLGRVANRVESGTPAFMLGQISPTGFPLYYPFVLLMKTPLPTLLLLSIGVGSLIASRDRRSITLVFPAALFLVAAMSSNLSLGYRLILPSLPFVLVIAGYGADRLWNARAGPLRLPIHAGRAVLVAAGVWLALDTLSIAPNHIAYFNPLAGNRDRNYELLVDSNLDWGQDLIALREWMRTQPIDALNLSYFGTAHPDAYGVHANLLPSFSLNDFGPEVDGFSAYALEPGWYAISATSLQLGLLYSHWDLYAPFRGREPDARIGRSILAYRINYPSVDVDRTVALGPLAGDLNRATLGGQPDRRLIVKWAGLDAAVLDMQGPARYVTRGGQAIVGFAPDVHNALLANAERLGSDASGQLRLFTIDARAALEAKLRALAHAEVSAPDQQPLRLPIEFEGGLALLGYDLTAQPGQPIDLVTYWQVRQRPTRRLAVFAHVLNSNGGRLAQGDGLQVRLSALEPGDVILQHFAIERPAGAAVVEAGLYDPDNQQRMLGAISGGAAIDRVRVSLP